MSINDTCREDNTVKIRYAGPTGNHLVASPLRKFSSYGMHTNGDVFCVHIDDQATVPHVFVLIEDVPSAGPVVVEPAPAAETATAESKPAPAAAAAEPSENSEAPKRRKKER